MKFELNDLPKGLREQARAKLGIDDKKPVAKPTGANKYNAKPTTIDGIKFASKSEGKRYSELKLMEQAGLISNLELQPRYLLQPAFVHQGKKYREIKYTADFRYIENGNIVVEERKGYRQRDYIMRKKLLLYTHPNIYFKETK